MRRLFGLGLTVTLAAMLHAGGAASAAPAGPVPDRPSGPSAGPAGARAGLDCGATILAFDRGNHAVIRGVHNRDVTYAKTSSKNQTFTVLGAALAGNSKVGDNGFDVTLATVNSDDRPRYITVTDQDRTTDQPLSTANHPFARKLSGQRLIANASGGYIYMVDTGGVLNRWTLYRTRSGGLVWGSPKQVRTGLGSLRTLAWDGTVHLAGRTTDLLWGTTRRGGLVQVRVQVGHLARSRVLTVKRSGFKGVSGISLSHCNGSVTFASLIAIHAGANKARWYTIHDQASPSSSQVVYRGTLRGATDLSWRLHAAL